MCNRAATEWRARIGLIAAHADLVPDAELVAMAPDGVTVHPTRVRFGAMDEDQNMDEPLEVAALRAYVGSPRLDEAAELLAGAPLSVIAYAFTSTSYLGGEADDEQLRHRLEARTNGLPVVTTCAAAVRAMHGLGVTRMALVHPPWITRRLNDMGAAYFRSQGLEVVIATSVDLAGGQAGVQHRSVHEWARGHVPDDAEVVFFGGNGFPAAGAIGALEADLGRPVLSANQVLLWAALGASGVSSRSIRGYGKLFSVPYGEVHEEN